MNIGMSILFRCKSL